MEDKQKADRAVLDLFVQQEYERALVAFREFQRRPDLEDLDRAKTHFNVATCLFELYTRGQAPADWEDQFLEEINGYLGQVEQMSLDKLAPDRLKDGFSLVLRFQLAVAPIDELGEKGRDTYQAFARRTARKVTGEEYLKVALSLIEQERRNYARADHAQRAAKLAEAVLHEIGEDDRFRAHRTAIYNLLADLAYFFPLSSEADNERYKRVSGYLKKALQATPHDDFARTFKAHVERLAATTLQIKRFGHDTKGRLANVRRLLEQMRARLPAGSELHQTVLALRREMHGLTVLGRLIEGQQPAQEDWGEADPVEIIRPLLQERGWPDGCLQRLGAPARWEFCPDYMRIALENMLRNTVEAYRRNRRELPAEPCRITVDYERRTITIRDWAGGIDPALGDVFAPYVSSKGVQTSTGLGLTQAREAIELQSSDFRLELAEPQPQHGTEFRIHIPPLN